MRTPQPGIFAVGTAAHCFLELSARPQASPRDLVRSLAAIEEPRTTVGGVNLVVGVRPSAWAQVAPEHLPLRAADFASPVVGPDGFTMPATQHDAWVWVSGAAPDLVFDVATGILAATRPVAELALEVTGWSYRHSRDLTGFEDGTENPSLDEAIGVVAVPPGEPGEGSSVVLLQQWVHLADAWTSLSEREQEEVIGRTKPDSVELADDVKPADSHVARTVLEVDGEELDIFRRNVPYGTVREHGTHFVGFSHDQTRLSRMLERMAGVGDGVRDALTRYTTPLSGSYYVVPAVETWREVASG